MGTLECWETRSLAGVLAGGRSAMDGRRGGSVLPRSLSFNIFSRLPVLAAEPQATYEDLEEQLFPREKGCRVMAASLLWTAALGAGLAQHLRQEQLGHVPPDALDPISASSTFKA